MEEATITTQLYKLVVAKPNLKMAMEKSKNNPNRSGES